MVYYNLPVEGLRDLKLTSVLLFAEIFEFVTEWLQKKFVINKLKNQGRTQGGGGCRTADTLKSKFKNHRFCRHDDIKCFT